jgi:hypothetical protein
MATLTIPVIVVLPICDTPVMNAGDRSRKLLAIREN